MSVEETPTANITKVDLKEHRIVNERNELYPITIVAKNIIRFEPFKSLKICTSGPSPIYLMFLGFQFKSVTKNFILQLLYNFFKLHDYHLMYKYIRELFEQMCLIHSVEPESIELNSNNILFTNGLFNLKTFQPERDSTEIIPGTQLKFPYKLVSSDDNYTLENYHKILPNFSAFMDSLCGGDRQKIIFLQCFLTCLV